MTDPIDAAIARFAPQLPLAVALSGGADSTALLRLACDLAPGRVQAFHIHHGLQDAADDFERHCVALCGAWQVPLAVVHAQARHAPGESPEDAARRARESSIGVAKPVNEPQRALIGGLLFVLFLLFLLPSLLTAFL